MADARGASNRDGGRRDGKSASAFRTISEVANELDVPQHVLRFWETKFPQVKPLKRAGGRRYYRPEDVAQLHTIRDLLYRDGYTIKGAQKFLRENGAKNRPAAGSAASLRDASAASALHHATDERTGGVAGAGAASRAASTAQRRVAGHGTETSVAGATGTARSVDRAELKAVLDELVALRELVRKRLG